MKILKPVKRIVLGLFDTLGYSITKKSRIDSKWINVTNAIEHNSKDQMDKFYSDDETLMNYFDRERIEFYKEIVNLAKDRDIFSGVQSIVDAGCGTGHLLHYLQQEFGFQRATGLEYSPEAIKVAKKKFPHFDFYEFDIYKSWNQKFDLILCTEVLEHLLYPDDALGNLFSMMKDNGRLLITVPNGRFDTFGGHINFWSPESWEVFIRKNSKNFYCETGLIHGNSANYALIKKEILKNG